MDLIISLWPRFLDATLLTLGIFVIVSLMSTTIGLLAALTTIAAGRWFTVLLAAYGWVFRGVPELVILLFCYLALPQLGLQIGPIGAAVLGFTLISTAYEIEIFRSGLAGVHRGQFEAARALGIPLPSVLRRIVLPQVIRIVATPWITYATGSIKRISIASAVAVTEIMQVTKQAIAFSHQPFRLILFAAILYATMASALMIAEIVVARRFKRRFGLSTEVP